MIIITILKEIIPELPIEYRRFLDNCDSSLGTIRYLNISIPEEYALTLKLKYPPTNFDVVYINHIKYENFRWSTTGKRQLLCEILKNIMPMNP